VNPLMNWIVLCWFGIVSNSPERPPVDFKAAGVAPPKALTYQEIVAFTQRKSEIFDCLFANIGVAMERSIGFTIIELLVVISIMAILATLAIPSYLDFFEKGRLRGATEAVYEQLQYARAQALKRSVPIIVDFWSSDPTTWAMGITDKSGGCDASNTTTCTIDFDFDNDPTTVDPVLLRLASTDFTNISMTTAPVFGTSGPGACPTTETTEACFEPIRGLSLKTSTSTHIQLTNGDYKLQVRVDEVGGVTICRPVGEKYFVGYNECPD